MSKIEEITEKVAAKICEQAGLYVYDVEYKKEGAENVLRVFIDSDNGVTLDDCEKVSRALSDILDEMDPIKTAYELEVSSPGIERSLSRDWHFKKVIGKKISLKLFGSSNGNKEITGILSGYDGKNVKVKTDDGEIICVEKEKTAQIKTVFEF